jgi:hypothetical protein
MYEDPRVSISILLMVNLVAVVLAQRSPASAEPGPWTKLLAVPVALMTAALVGAIRMGDTLGIVGVVIVAVVYAGVSLYMVRESYRVQGKTFARDVLAAMVMGLVWTGGQWLFGMVKWFH